MGSSASEPANRAKFRRMKPKRSVSFSLPALDFPLASFMHPLRSTAAQWLVIPIVLMAGFLFRWAVGLGPYSGMGSPPMYGDFEAQRHWMEITLHLPIKEWYWHDLQWWGLDYPPLTAYHSWVIGFLGNIIDPSWFALRDSRALEDTRLKAFMRATVVISEYLTYVPAVVVFVRIYGKQAGLSSYDKAIALAAILLQPSLMIIDHGHFQYNTVMFGFVVLAVDCFLSDHVLWGSAFFVLALCFKQMALYYAPVVFAYLLGRCLRPRINFLQLILIGSVVLATFTAMLAPLVVSGGVEQVTQCIHRIFPFSRGLWEDKVANFWCAANVGIKFRERFSSTTLQRASLLSTLAGIMPACLIIFAYPRKRLLPLALSACAWSFFLFSFQVHEKSVLLPLVPTTLLLAGSLDSDDISWIAWMNNIAMFSLWPLLRRDGLIPQYLVLWFLYAWLMGSFRNLPQHWIGKLIHCSSYVAAGGIHFAEVVIGRIERYPDLWVVANVLICFGAYVILWAWTVLKLWKEANADKQKTA